MISTSARLLSAFSLACVAVLTAVLVASDGFFSVDEVVYFLGAQTLALTGGFAIPNGFSEFASPDLRILLLSEGPGGLVPQYPAGTALAGAPLIPVFGQRTLIALNVAAGIGTLFAAHALARRLFGEARVADLAVGLLVFATFWSGYVFGHWPHSVSVLCTTLALVLFLGALDRAERAWLPALLSGLAVGVGMLFRLDGVLLLPAIVAATILWAVRPVHVLAGGAAGLLPPVLLLAATNAAKFGTWNPLSYGSSGGGTDLARHVVPIAAILAALAGLVVLRALRDTAIGPRLWRMAPLAALAGLGLILLTPLAPHVWSLMRGIRAILLDATTISDPRPGVVGGPGGTLSFWGFPKKALAQSLPWLGCLALLAGARRAPHARGIALVLMVFAMWALPFLMRSWHGGLGSNMRYLLPTLPALCALAALAILDLIDRTGGGTRPLVIGVVGGLVLSVAWLGLLPGAAAHLHQIVSLHMFYAVAGTALLAAVAARPVTAAVALAMTGVGIGLAAVLAVSDMADAQSHRALNAARSEAVAAIGGPVVFYGAPEAFSHAMRDPDQLIAHPARMGGEFDTGLIDAACAAGYRIIVEAWLAGMHGGLGDRTLTPLVDEASAGGALLELSCVRRGSS